MTQFDVSRIQNIEATTKVKLSKYEVDEHDVLKLLNIVTALRKEVEIVSNAMVLCSYVLFLKLLLNRYSRTLLLGNHMKCVIKSPSCISFITR